MMRNCFSDELFGGPEGTKEGQCTYRCKQNFTTTQVTSVKVRMYIKSAQILP